MARKRSDPRSPLLGRWHNVSKSTRGEDFFYSDVKGAKMRRALGPTIVLVAVGALPAFASPRDASSRFSPEAVALLQMISFSYDINGVLVQDRPRDPQELQRLSRSSDGKIAVVASLALVQGALRAENLNARADKPVEGKPRSFDEILANSLKRLEPLARDYEVRLIAAPPGGRPLPAKGVRLLIVAVVGKTLHFRIFDATGKMSVDAGESMFEGQADAIDDLRKQLGALWPPHSLTPCEHDEIVSAVGVIVGQPSLQDDPAERLRVALAALQDEILAPRKQADQYVNRVLVTQLKGFALNLLLKEASLALAEPPGAELEGDADAISVRIETAPGKYGSIVLTNRSGRTLHHCLVITRLIPNRSRSVLYGALAETQPALLKELGINADTVDEMAKTHRLRTMLDLLEQGVMIFVPEIPAGAAVRTSVGSVAWLRAARSADLSLVCDELSLTGVQAQNLEKIRSMSLPRPGAMRGVAGFPVVPGQGRGTGGFPLRPVDGSGGVRPLGGGIRRGGLAAGDESIAPPRIQPVPRASDAVTLRRQGPDSVELNGPLAGGRAAFPLSKDRHDEGAPARTPPVDDPQVPREASKSPAFETFKRRKTITLVTASEPVRDKGLSFPACVPSGGSYRPNGKTVTLDATASMSLTAIAVGPDAYVALARDSRTRGTSLILVPRSRVRDVKD